MTDFDLAYGKTTVTIQIPNSFKVDVIHPRYVPPSPDAYETVKQAIEHPIGGKLIEDFRGASTVAIAVNDKTRPVPNNLILSPLLEGLGQLGFTRDQVTIYIATGTHLPMPANEFPLILPHEIYTRYKVVSHDTDQESNLLYLGQTRMGTPVWVNQAFYQSDLKIVTGNIEPHHFAGFSGGVKTAAIGLAGRATINKNHNLLTDPKSEIGRYDANPLRQDIEEIGRLIGIHFALNVILTEEKEIVQALFGEPRKVMEAGISLSRAICQIPVTTQYDLVIASAGGYPKDINLYQSQKAVTHASQITRPGGTILLLAECSEGVGSQSYIQWMEGVETTEEVFQKAEKEGLRVGPHKAYQFARQTTRYKLLIYSTIPGEMMEKLLLTPVLDLHQSISQILAQLDSSRRVAILPQATHTIPYIE